MLNCFFSNPLHGTTWFDVFLRESRFGSLGCGALEEPKKEAEYTFLMRNFAHTRKRNPLRNRDRMSKCCMWDLITCATFGDDRLRGLGLARGRISGFSIDLRRPTVSAYGASNSDIHLSVSWNFAYNKIGQLFLLMT